MGFYFSHKRNKEVTYQFLRHCLRCYDLEQQPKTLNTDKHSSYVNAIARLKEGGRLPVDVEQRQVKCLNNGIESEHALSKSEWCPLVVSKYENGLGQRFKDLNLYEY